VVQRDISIGAFFWLVRGPRKQRAHSSGASAPRPHVQFRSVVSAWREYVRTGSPKLRERCGAAAQARLVEFPARRQRPLPRPASPRRLRVSMRADAGRVRAGPVTAARRVAAPCRVFRRRLGGLARAFSRVGGKAVVKDQGPRNTR